MPKLESSWEIRNEHSTCCVATVYEQTAAIRDGSQITDTNAETNTR